MNRYLEATGGAAALPAESTSLTHARLAAFGFTGTLESWSAHDGRRYSRLTRDLAIAAGDEGIPVTLITDPNCDWAPGVVTELFAVPTDLNHFWDTTAAMSSLIGLLVNGVFRELGAEVEDRMARVSALYDDFIGHTVPGRNPGKA